MYVVFLEDLEMDYEICLVANAENDSWLWHRRLGHVSMHTMSKLSRKNLVIGQPNLKFENDKICDACKLGKQVRTSFKTKKVVSTSRPLELMHIDLFGLISTTSLGGKSYGFVIVDDYFRIEAIRLLLAFACFMNFKLFQMDVKSAFLNGFIQEEVYVEQPPEFKDYEKPNHVFKPHKALYGLKQASRAWYERLSKFLVEKGYVRGSIDTTLFIKRYLKDLIIVQIYVDDIVLGVTNEALCKNFAKEMQGEFDMSMMGELKYFLGLQIKQCEKGIFINQERYTQDMLKRFDMLKLKSIYTPMSPSTRLDLDEKGKDVDQKLYRGMIRSLLYLTASRPDIQFSTCLCARLQSQPKESHMTSVKRIFRYLIDTQTLGIWYPRESSFSLVGYSEADFASSKTDRKSTSGTCQFLGNMLVSWSSKKQNLVALSTAKAEYVSLGNCYAQILWIKQQLKDYGMSMNNIPIYCDNKSVINISKNPVQHSRTKHIEIRHHFVRDHVVKGDIKIEFVNTLHQLADIFTKPLNENRFYEIRRNLGMISMQEL
ncbi:Reverse transcriptase [Theobroma cacao]|nr:Reverse transcriptase [Theobroma cacao]